MTGARSFLCGIALGIAALAASGPAAAAPSEAIVNCGTWSQNPSLELINYNSVEVSCQAAFAVIDRFYGAQQKYASVDSWDCGILGAAEGERMGGVAIRCRGPLGELRVETI